MKRCAEIEIAAFLGSVFCPDVGQRGKLKNRFAFGIMPEISIVGINVGRIHIHRKAERGVHVYFIGQAQEDHALYRNFIANDGEI